MSDVRVLIVDDNRLAAEALRRWFTRTPGWRWAGWADDPEKALRLVEQSNPDVVLLDVDMPGYDTAQLLRTIVRNHPRSHVVMFSGHVSAELIEQSLADGAGGYIVKDDSLAEASELIRRAARGECVLSPAAAIAFMNAR